MFLGGFKEGFHKGYGQKKMFSVLFWKVDSTFLGKSTVNFGEKKGKNGGF